MQTSVKATSSGFTVGEFNEVMALPPGANCPQQWLLLEYYPALRRNLDSKHSWYVAAANKGGVGGAVYRFNWGDTTAELWFQLPPGDFVLDVQWTKENGWQALTIGGDPRCAEVQPSNEYMTTRCALQKGTLYLVDDGGQYRQLVASNGVGRCEASFNPSGTAVAFRESNLCFSFLDQEVSSQIYIIDLSNNQMWVIEGDESRSNPIWSPDGNWIACEAATAIGSMKVFNDQNITLRGSQIQVVEVQSHQIHALSPTSVDTECTFVASSWPQNIWSPDSRKLIWTCSEKVTDTQQVHTLEVFNIGTHTRHEVARVEQSLNLYTPWNDAAWLPENETVIWKTTSMIDSGVNVSFTFQNLESGTIHSLEVNSPTNLVWPRESSDGHIWGFIRATSEQDFLELVSWSNLAVARTVELPGDIEWLDLYWIAD